MYLKHLDVLLCVGGRGGGGGGLLVSFLNTYGTQDRVIRSFSNSSVHFFS